jgi:hypothetical protein
VHNPIAVDVWPPPEHKSDVLAARDERLTEQCHDVLDTP